MDLQKYNILGNGEARLCPETGRCHMGSNFLIPPISVFSILNDGRGVDGQVLSIAIRFRR